MGARIDGPDAGPHEVMTSPLRQRLIGGSLEAFFEGASALARLAPKYRPENAGVKRVRDLRYGHGPARTLDVWYPSPSGSRRLRPAVLYLHGGGFRMLSKDSHWIFGLSYAERGYVVFNANYRLSPEHRFPAAVDDAFAAYRWVVENAERHGADPERIIIAGESAGANLALGITIAATFERPELEARKIFAAGVVPRALVPACGLLQVSDMARYDARHGAPGWIRERMEMIERGYLGPADLRREQGDLGLADPLVLLESEVASVRRLPPVFAPVGSHDPIKDDTRRLAAALTRRGIRCDAPVYQGEHHAFHAFRFRPQARRAWHDTFTFLEEVCADERVDRAVTEDDGPATSAG